MVWRGSQIKIFWDLRYAARVFAALRGSDNFAITPEADKFYAINGGSGSSIIIKT